MSMAKIYNHDDPLLPIELKDFLRTFMQLKEVQLELSGYDKAKLVAERLRTKAWQSAKGTIHA